MNLNRDEFLLLSRTGRGPHSTRASPPSHEPPEPERSGRRFRPRADSGLSLRAGAASRLRHVLSARPGRSAGPSRTLGYRDEQTYFEMEFAVGFPAEEETLR